MDHINDQLNLITNNCNIHVALLTTKTINIKGINSDRIARSNSNIKTHAEINALLKLENLIRCKKIKKSSIRKGFNLIVIRICPSGKLGESAPCHHCTLELQRNNLIKINKLYYSKQSGCIECINFNEWIKLKHIKSSGYRKYENKKK